MIHSKYKLKTHVSSGFTLLEIVFVLGMISIITAWMVLSVSSTDTEHRLREASGGIESLVKRARSVAVMQQRPYQVTISAKGLKMEPQFLKSEIEGGDSYFERTRRDKDVDEAEERSFDDVTATEDLDEKVVYEIRRWRSNEWLKIEKDNVVVLTLDSTGLVEPISIRCSIGESWIMQKLHPLTGGVDDEEMMVKD